MADAATVNSYQSDKNEKFRRLGSGDIKKLLLEFSLPAMVGIIVQSFYNIIDSIYVGHGVGELGLASTTVSLPMMILMVALSMLIGAGGNALAAIRLGQDAKDDAEKILGQSFALLIVMYFVTLIIFFLAMEPILKLSGATPAIMDLSKTFLGIIVFGSIFNSIAFGLNNFIRTAGDPKRALNTMIIGAVVNTILGYIFVIVLDWGMAGAAFATMIAWIVSAITVLEFFLNKNAPLRLRREYIRIDTKTALRIMSLGVPPFVMQFGVAVVTTLENQMLVQYGSQDPTLGTDGALAVMAVLGRVAMLVIVPAIGFSMGAQPIVGFNYGAQKFRRMRQTMNKAILYATIPITIFWAIVMLFPGQVSSLFNLPDQHKDIAAVALRAYLALGPLLGYTIVSSTYFQATGQALKASLLTLSRQVIFLIPLIILSPRILPLFFPISPVISIFLAATISDFFSVILISAFYLPEMKRLVAREDQQAAELASAQAEQEESEKSQTLLDGEDQVQLR